MLTAFTQVFRHTQYLLIVAAILLIAVTIVVWLPNHATLHSVFASSELSVMSKLWFFVSLYASLWTAMSVWQTLYLLVVSLLFGINVALITYYIKRKQQGKKIAGYQLASIGGMVSAVLGIGCMACGSVIVTALLGVAGATTLYAVMPLHGYEFGLVGLVVLVVSIYYISSRINDPQVC